MMEDFHMLQESLYYFFGSTEPQSTLRKLYLRAICCPHNTEYCRDMSEILSQHFCQILQNISS